MSLDDRPDPSTPPNEKLLYRIPEVAKALSLSPRKVRSLIEDGRLASFKVDSCRVVRHQDLMAFVRSLQA
jgi:excisionase family DNA binding protein